MTIAILSWRAEQTLQNTLESYAYHRLDSLDDDRLVLLQEGTDMQAMMVSDFGWTPVITQSNLGIAAGYRLLLNMASGDTFLFLENDWKLLRDPELQFRTARAMLQYHEAEIVRFRDRENPGNPLWTRQFEGREYDRPTHLLDSIHWTNPDKFPEINKITKKYWMFEPLDYEYSKNDYEIPDMKLAQSEWYITQAKYANWTNNPHMGLTSFLRQYVAPKLGDGNLERDIQGWWEQQDFRVAQGEGLFTHERLD